MKSRWPSLQARAGSGLPVVAVGLAAFLAGGVLTALLAARFLSSPDYTVYAAYSSLIGILVLGPAGSLEQETTLRASRAGGHSQLIRSMLVRGTAIIATVTVLLVLPLAGWQDRLLGSSVGVATASVVLGSPVVFAAAIGRGFLTAGNVLRPVGAANAATGTAMLSSPVLLHLAGVGWLTAFLVGALVAWLPALLVIGLRVNDVSHRSGGAEGGVEMRHRVTAWLLAGNLLMLTTLLAVPAVLRWHVRALGAAQVADAQLLVSISRLSTTVVLGFLAVMVARLSRQGSRPGIGRLWFALAAGLGLTTVVVLAVLGNPLVSWLRAEPSHLSLEVNLLTTLPAVTLCPAVVAMGMAIAQERWRLIVTAWAAALATLVGAGAFVPGGTIAGVLVLIAIACALPLVVLVLGLTTGPRKDVVAP